LALIRTECLSIPIELFFLKSAEESENKELVFPASSRKSEEDERDSVHPGDFLSWNSLPGTGT
jgi:hypothetical protein